MVLDNHKRLRRLQVLLACRRQFQQAVILDILLQITRYERLTDDGTPQFFINTLARSEQFVVLMLMGNDFFCLTTDNKILDIVGTEILLDSLNDLQRQDQLVLRLNLCLRMQAVIAIVTIILVIGLSEIVKQHLPTAHAGLSVGGRLLQQLPSYVLLCNGLALHELIQLTEILIGIEG